MRSLQKTGVQIRVDFVVYDANDAVVTGLTNGNFTKSLFKDGATSAVTVTVTEVGSGVYTATFTPTGTGKWYLLITHATHNPRGWEEHFDVTTDGAFDIDSILDKTDGVETGVTLRQALRAMAAVLAGKASGGPSGSAFKGIGTNTSRVTVTADSNGDRSAVTLNL